MSSLPPKEPPSTGALNVHLRLGQVEVFGNHRPGTVSILNRPLDGHYLFIIIQVGGDRFRLNIAVLLKPTSYSRSKIWLEAANPASISPFAVWWRLMMLLSVRYEQGAPPGFIASSGEVIGSPRGVGDFDFIDRDAGCLVGFRRHHGNHVAAIGDLLVDNRRMIGNDRPSLRWPGISFQVAIRTTPGTFPPPTGRAHRCARRVYPRSGIRHIAYCS